MLTRYLWGYCGDLGLTADIFVMEYATRGPRVSRYGRPAGALAVRPPRFAPHMFSNLLILEFQKRKADHFAEQRGWGTISFFIVVG